MGASMTDTDTDAMVPLARIKNKRGEDEDVFWAKPKMNPISDGPVGQPIKRALAAMHQRLQAERMEMGALTGTEALTAHFASNDLEDSFDAHTENKDHTRRIEAKCAGTQDIKFCNEPFTLHLSQDDYDDRLLLVLRKDWEAYREFIRDHGCCESCRIRSRRMKKFDEAPGKALLAKLAKK